MPLTPVNSGDRITSTAWNSMITEINGKVTKTGDIMTGPLTVADAVKVRSINFVDSANNTYLDNWIGMAENIEGATKWLHIGGITDSGARRIALFADKTIIRGGASTSLDVGGSIRARSLSLTTADNTGNNMSITRDATTLTVNMGFAPLVIFLPGQPPPPPLLYNFRIGHQGGFLVLGGGDSFVSRFSVNQDGLISVSPSGKLSFGNKTRQMIDLWSTEYGIGIQNSTLYFRTFDAFYWYKGGVHDDNRGANSGGGLEMMSLQADGRLLLRNGAGSIGQVSDERLKKNIKTLDKALDKLTQLRGVNFQWKEPELRGGDTTVQTGFIAQEVEQVFPHWIHEHDEHKSISMPGLDALVVESLKELKAEIDKIRTHLKI